MTASRTASHSLLITVMLATLAGLGLAGATPASAAVTSSFTTIQCGGGQVKAMAGVAYTNQNETVFWAPVLYAWTGATWSQVNTGALQFAYAGSVNGRTGGWSDLSNNAGVSFRAFNVPANRSYAVFSYFWTQSGGWRASLATYGNTYYCTA